MRRTLLFSLILLVALGRPLFAAENYPNPKVKKCIKDKECQFVLSGASTQDPKMSFVVYEKVWKTFRDRDKDQLRDILKRRIEDARENPDKYMHTSKKAHRHDMMRVNVKNMRSYSVFLSYGKSRKGGLQMDEEIMVNY